MTDTGTMLAYSQGISAVLKAENARLRAALHKAGDQLKAAAYPYAATQAHAAADMNQEITNPTK